MGATLLSRAGLAPRGLSDVATPPVVDERASTGAVLSTLLNPDGDGKNYRLATWNTDGVFAVLSPGEVEYLVLSGAGAGGTYGGQGGRPLSGKAVLPAGLLPVTVVAGATSGTDTGVGQLSGFSQLGSIITGRSGAGMNYVLGARGGYPVAGTDYNAGFPSSITGTLIEYGRAGRYSPAPAANRGEGGVVGQPSPNGSSGVVIARWEI